MQSKASFWLFIKSFKLFWVCWTEWCLEKNFLVCTTYSCLISSKNVVLAKQKWYSKNRGLHLILSHDTSDLLFSGVFRTIIASLSSLRHYFAFDSGLDKINSRARQILLGHPVMHRTRQQLRGGHKREAFANRVMDTHARVPRASLQKNLEYKINFRAQKRWENRTHTF